MSLDAAAPQRAQYQVQAEAGYHGMAPLPPGDSTDPSALNNTMFADYPLKGIAHPHPHDVLCGRGGQSNSHPGNAQWRMLVAANKELYVSLPKKQKMLLSQSIVNAVRSQNPPGRFLQKDGNNSSWYDVGDKRAQEKTSQALREGAPEIRTKLHTTPLTSPNPGAAVTVVGSSSSPVGLNSSEHGDDEVSKEVIPPVLSEPRIDRSSSQQLPPKLVEVTSSASVGSSATQPTGNQSKQLQPVNQQQSSSQSYNQHNPLPYTSSDVPPAYSHPYHPSTQHVYPGCPPPHHLHPAPLDYAHVHTMAPPSVLPQTPIPPQGPIPERKSKKHQQQPAKTGPDHTVRLEPKNGDVNNNSEIAEIDELYVPTIRDDKYSQSQSSGHPVTADHFSNISKLNQQSKLQTNENIYENSFDEAPIAPPALDGNGEFSFGSTLMISDLEQARLMNGCSFGTAMSYGYTGNQPHDNNRPIPTGFTLRSSNRDQSIESDTPLPVDGGLEPVGLSFGSMMSTGTALAIGENVRLEGAGLSFGSMMSYAYTPQNNVGGRTNTVPSGPHSAVPSAVDGGLEDIGTSMGSLTLDPEERQRIIESAKSDMMNGLGDNPEMPPPSFHARKSKSNLLLCSDSDDSEDEAESKSEQLSAQKSLGWERMQAALAAHTTASGVSCTSEKYSATNNNNSYSQIPHFAQNDSRNYVSTNISPNIVAPATLNIPTTSFARDFSQMSAISVNDEDYREQALDHSSFQYNSQNRDLQGGKTSTYNEHDHQSQYTYPQQQQYEEQTSWYEPEPYPYHQQQYVVPNSISQGDSGRRRQHESYSRGYDNTTHAMMPPPPAPQQVPPSSNNARQGWNQHNHHDRNYQGY